MLKRYLKLSVIFITLFSCLINKINAYEYQNPNNQQLINNMIGEIYDAKEQYEDLVGGYDKKTVKKYDATNSSYWWPIGSEETTEANGKKFAQGDPYPTSLTSPYGYRDDPLGRGKQFHHGVDLAGAAGNGIVNIIAVKSGVVIYPTKGVSNNCPSSNSLSDCGGGYGNYVVLQHSDGIFTVYAHLDAGSIDVVAGESVEQGQVIGKMGSSGNSTGTHLHFEVRSGQFNERNTHDPLDYISQEEPRKSVSGGEFLAWLNSWEGTGKKNGNNYVVEALGDGVRTVGGGVTLEHNPDSFKKHGIDIKDYPTGSEIPMEIVDQIQLEEIAEKRSSIEKILANNSIVLEEKQIQALVSQKYNTGNINGFAENYKKYGNTQELYDNWFFRAIMKGTKFEKGLTRRRNSEWSLFHLGEYVYNG